MSYLVFLLFFGLIVFSLNIFIRTDDDSSISEEDYEYKPIIFKMPHVEGLGCENIKVGDKFEGYACGNWITDQVCFEINDNYVIPESRVASFDKKYIRLIK